jgi:hypothetical protein
MLDRADEIWTLGLKSQIQVQDATNGNISSKSSRFQSECNGRKCALLNTVNFKFDHEINRLGCWWRVWGKVIVDGNYHTIVSHHWFSLVHGTL